MTFAPSSFACFRSVSDYFMSGSDVTKVAPKTDAASASVTTASASDKDASTTYYGRDNDGPQYRDSPPKRGECAFTRGYYGLLVAAS